MLHLAPSSMMFSLLSSYSAMASLMFFRHVFAGWRLFALSDVVHSPAFPIWVPFFISLIARVSLGKVWMVRLANFSAFCLTSYAYRFFGIWFDFWLYGYLRVFVSFSLFRFFCFKWIWYNLYKYNIEYKGPVRKGVIALLWKSLCPIVHWPFSRVSTLGIHP